MHATYNGMDTKKAESFLYHKGCDIVDGQYGFYTRPKKEGDKPQFVPCGSAVEVQEVVIDIETMKRKLKLISYDYSGRGTQITFHRNMMTEQGILALTEYGAQVDKKSAPTLLKCIENEEMKAPVTYEHSSLGFSQYENQLIFKGNKAINIKSNYIGESDIKPKGSYKKWRNMIKKEVLGSPLEIILASALSSTVLDFIHDEYPTDNILLSLVGGSSSGKTTALNLAVSVGGSPALSGRSLMLSFIDTELSIVHKICSAFPAGIDEFTAIGNQGIKKLLYTLANGSERSRMNKNLKLNETKEFHTAIFMSSEYSILSSAGTHEGLIARVLEFSNIEWTTSGASADEIKKICLSNYGWAVPKMAKYLLEVNKQDLIHLCEEYTELFLEKQESENGVIIRMSKKIGLILATAHIAEDIFGFEFDLDRMICFFNKNIKMNPEDFDNALKAYEAVISYVVERPTEFGENLNDGTLQTNDVYYKSGRIEYSDAPVELYDGTISEADVFIKKVLFDRILFSMNFYDTKSILKRLDTLGLLFRPEKDRLYCRVKLGVDEIVVKGYRLRIKTDVLHNDLR